MNPRTRVPQVPVTQAVSLPVLTPDCPPGIYFRPFGCHPEDGAGVPGDFFQITKLRNGELTASLLAVDSIRLETNNYPGKGNHFNPGAISGPWFPLVLVKDGAQ